MQTILILFGGEPSKSPTKDPLGYSALYTYFAKNNIILCRAPISYYDTQSNSFTQAQFFINDNWLWKKNITPDVIYDKSPYYINSSEMLTRQLIATDYTFYNNLTLSKILSNKSLTFDFFEEFSAKTIVINMPSEVTKIIALQTSDIIVKPLSQSGGSGIFISKKEAVANDIISNNIFPILAQEFMDSSKAKNEFIDGYHDIRVIVRNQTPFYAFARIPKKDTRIANVSTGATLKVIPIKELLQNNDINKFINKIIQNVENIDATNKIYAIDCMFDNDNNLWLIEMNSRPGLTLEQSEAPYQSEFYENLLTFFK
ncbi:MAG: RimK family alpha-L-glutamate ligase [Candidatus Moraniibacteriota bacterium]|jgi:glutathione synthetase-like protein